VVQGLPPPARAPIHMRRYGAEMMVVKRAARLVCPRCGSHNTEFTGNALPRNERLL
jgi:hypothetical protein